MWKNKETTKCDKNTIICDVGTTQCGDAIIKCEKKKIRKPPNVTKVQYLLCWYCTMWRWCYQMCEKKNGTTKCDKSTVTCDICTTQCEDGTIKCEEKKKKREPLNMIKV